MISIAAAVESALGPYSAWTQAASSRDAGEETELTERERLAVALVALGNQERMLVLETLARRAASPSALQALMRNADALVEGARSGGRLGYKRAAEAALAFPLSFRAAYFFYRRFGIRRFLEDRLGERFETLLVTRLLIQELADGSAKSARSIFGERVAALIDSMLAARLNQTQSALGALRRQYVDHAAALEARFLRRSASAQRDRPLPGSVRRGPDPGRGLPGSDEPGRGRSERRSLRRASTSASILEISSARLELFAGPRQRATRERAASCCGRASPCPKELIVRKGEPGDSMFFIASGAVEVRCPTAAFR